MGYVAENPALESEPFDSTFAVLESLSASRPRASGRHA